MKLRARQMGYAEGLVPLMTLIIFTLLGVLLIVFVVSFVIPFVWLKGKARIVIVVCVISLWGYVYWSQIGTPEAQKRWRVAGWAQCEKEQAQPVGRKSDSAFRRMVVNLMDGDSRGSIRRKALSLFRPTALSTQFGESWPHSLDCSSELALGIIGLSMSNKTLLYIQKP